MWIFDYFKKRGKKEQEQRRLEEEVRRQKVEQEQIAREREWRLEENQRKEQERQAQLRAEKEAASSIEPFTFKSNCHQRYENDSPVKGLQECGRTVKVEKNTSGCHGYKLQPGLGYIVKIYNDDAGKPNMSDKPMKVVRKTKSFIELRGFPIEAQSPFGWQEVDYSDYGFTVYYKENKVEKCVLHMYDRNVRIEYMENNKRSADINRQEQAVRKTITMTETEQFVQEALMKYSTGNEGDVVYHPLFKAWRSFQNNTDQLKNIIDCGKYGMGLMMFLSYGTINDIDDKQQLASVAYLFLSKAIKETPNNMNFIKNRLLLMISYHEAFEYTVSSVVNKDTGIIFMNYNPFKARDAIYKMEFADLSRSPQLLNIGILARKHNDLQEKISQNFFGINKNNQSIIAEGDELHQQILEHLEEKVIDEGDVDF